MNERILIDTGPLISLLGEDAADHDWCIEQWKRFDSPSLTCEAVITEASFLLKRDGHDPDLLFDLIDRGLIELNFALKEQLADVRMLMKRYSNRPMSFADACLVRLAELNSNATVFTLDSDFRIYRKHGNKVISLLIPDR